MKKLFEKIRLQKTNYNKLELYEEETPEELKDRKLIKTIRLESILILILTIIALTISLSIFLGLTLAFPNNYFMVVIASVIFGLLNTLIQRLFIFQKRSRFIFLKNKPFAYYLIYESFTMFILVFFLMTVLYIPF